LGQHTLSVTSNLNLVCRLNIAEIPASQQPRLVYLLVEVAVRGQVDLFAPLNLSLVVDGSESMRIRLVTEAQFRDVVSMGAVQEIMADGVPAWQAQNLPRSLVEQFPRKVDYVIEALGRVAELLGPNDVVSLVAFAREAQLLLPLTSGAEKQQILTAIRAFSTSELGDETYLGGGMGLGYAGLQTAVSPKHVNRMVLLTDGFAHDVAHCWQWMEQCRAKNIAISTMGVGDEFNEELLIPMAEKTGGHAYFIHKPDDIVAVFQQELRAAQSVSFRNSELKLNLTPGVELRKVYRVKPSIGLMDSGPNEGGSYTIFLGDVEQNAPPSLLLELITPARGNGRFRIAQLLLSSDPINDNRQTVRQDVVLDYSPSPGPLNPHVMDIVDRMAAFQLQTRALEDIATGNLSAATQKLRAAATRLLDMGEGELAQAVQRQAASLEQKAALDPQTTKRLRYDTRRLTQKLP
jgi:Ca-activated chloride channel homolog